MTTVWHIIKLVGAVVFGFAGAVCLFVSGPALAAACGIVSLSFSHMPE